MSPRTEVAGVIARQDGLIAVQQARSLGLTEHQIRGLRARGEWIEVRRGVLRTVESRLTPDASIPAVALWAGGAATVSGPTAAYWWRLVDDVPRTIELTIPRHRRLRPPGGVTVIRRPLPAQDRVTVRGVPVTGIALTALHAAIQLGDAGPTLLDRALQTRVSFAEVRAAHYRNLGCHGSKAAGGLLAAAADGAAAASERLFIRLLKKAGIRGWRVNHRVDLRTMSVVLDVAFVRERIAIEIDGWAWHHAPDRFQRDRRKQNALVAAGWRVLRFTWFDLTQRPEYVVAQVLAALAG